VQRKYQIATDMTDLVGETFLASTVGCARCHNHKADKVTQKEYFQLQAYFANTSFDEKAPAAKGRRRTGLREAAERLPRSDQGYPRAAESHPGLSAHGGRQKYHKERYLTDSREAIFKPETRMERDSTAGSTTA
jgi:hypothetical protein